MKEEATRICGEIGSELFYKSTQLPRERPE